jgi:hypothetical protein
MTRAFTALLVSGALAAGACAVRDAVKMLASGDTEELRSRSPAEPQRSPGHPGIVVLALDGVGRDLLYEMLERGELPELSSLLGGQRDRFPHAHFDRTTLSALPSTTLACWVTAFTGTPPAEHGITGNERAGARESIPPEAVRRSALGPALRPLISVASEA